VREITRIRQSDPELKKRWFTNANLDFFIWTKRSSNQLHSFHLAYDKDKVEQIAVWNRTEGLSFHTVDDGHWPGKHPGTPILITNSDNGTPKLLSLLQSELTSIDSELTSQLTAILTTEVEKTISDL